MMTKEEKSILQTLLDALSATIDGDKDRYIKQALTLFIRQLKTDEAQQ